MTRFGAPTQYSTPPVRVITQQARKAQLHHTQQIPTVTSRIYIPDSLKKMLLCLLLYTKYYVLTLLLLWDLFERPLPSLLLTIGIEDRQ